MPSAPDASQRSAASDVTGRRAPIFRLDWRTCGDDEPFITGAAIMALAGIPGNQGVLLCHADGTEEIVTEDQRVKLILAKGVSKKSARRKPRATIKLEPDPRLS